MFPEDEVGLTDARRRSLTQVDVMSDAHEAPLNMKRVAIAILIFTLYWSYVLPMISSWGTGQWRRRVEIGLVEPRAGGPGADAHWAIMVLVAVSYLWIIFFGVRYMEYRPPARKRVFEWIVVYNASQALLNLRLAVALLQEAYRLGYRWPFGNQLDVTERGHQLGLLIWYVYHCRQLDLLETVFMILRKKFQRVSLVHVYLRLLNLLGWFLACRFACGGDTFFQATVHAACQAVVYLYYVLHLLRPQGVPFFRKAKVVEIQVLQFIVCAIHGAFVLLYGSVPRTITSFNLFVMANCLIFFIDFDDEHPRLGLRKTMKSQDEGFGHEQVTLCFDSCGWFFVYHFGVAQWVSEHLLPEGMTASDTETSLYPKGIAFSGSSGGSLVAGALGSGINVHHLFEYVLELRDWAKWNPFKIFPALESALVKFLPSNCARSLSGRVRVLLTRVKLSPPFIAGEIVDQYRDWNEAFHTLRASCHIPGCSLFPWKLNGRYYFDGLMWSSFFVPWVSDDSLTIRISAISRPLTDIRAPFHPLWWALFPPREDVLRGLYWIGYREAARWFTTPPVSRLERCRLRRSSSKETVDDGDNTEVSTFGQQQPGPRLPRVRSLTEMQELGNRFTKFEAAQKLIVRPCSLADLPIVDPTTGQQVEEIILSYHRAVDINLGILFVFTVIITFYFLIVPLTDIVRTY
jgi:elongation of very long chain fatty acids protein 4